MKHIQFRQNKEVFLYEKDHVTTVGRHYDA